MEIEDAVQSPGDPEMRTVPLKFTLNFSLFRSSASVTGTRCAEVKWEFVEVKRTDNKDHSYLVGDPSWDVQRSRLECLGQIHILALVLFSLLKS